MNTKERDSRLDGKPVPENLPEELLPLYDWWMLNGQKFIVCLVTVAVIAAGVFVYRNHQVAKATAVNSALLNAQSVEDLEIAVSENGGAKGGNALRLRLAKEYFNSGKYEDSLRIYDECLAGGNLAGFESIAILGRAHALEAVGKNEEALKEYRSFQKEFENSYLILKAQLGEARALALLGKKAEAKEYLENLKVKLADDGMAEARINALIKLVDRYTPRAKRSLFEMSDEILKKGEKAPAIPAVAEKPAAVSTNAPAKK